MLCFGGFIMLLVAFLLCHCAHGRPDKDNAAFVNSDSMQEEHHEMCGEIRRNVSRMQSVVAANVFQSGIWSARYYQYGKWHGPNEMLLRFNPRSTKINGWGWDDVGKFTVKGVYSQQTRRIGLTKTYQVGTGNKAQNLGHNVNIQLTENSRSRNFEGKWYVQTINYHGEDMFELSFNRLYKCEEV